MSNLMAKCATVVVLTGCLSGIAAAGETNRCDEEILNGQYVFTASGFTRTPGSGAGAPWVPKAILEILHFNGNGTLTVPAVTVANPFGDSGNILQPPSGGAPGSYVINADCTGTVVFSDANGVTFNIYVDPPRGDTIWLIQTNPGNNVFQGTARRVW